MVDTLFASFSWPGFFPPAEMLGSAYIDGSSVYDLDIYAGINKCLSQGYEQEKIVVDALLTSSGALTKF